MYRDVIDYVVDLCENHGGRLKELCRFKEEEEKEEEDGQIMSLGITHWHAMNSELIDQTTKQNNRGPRETLR